MDGQNAEVMHQVRIEATFRGRVFDSTQLSAVCCAVERRAAPRVFLVEGLRLFVCSAAVLNVASTTAGPIGAGERVCAGEQVSLIIVLARLPLLLTKICSK